MCVKFCYKKKIFLNEAIFTNTIDTIGYLHLIRPPSIMCFSFLLLFLHFYNFLLNTLFCKEESGINGDTNE